MIRSPVGTRWWNQEENAAHHMYTDRFIAELERAT